MAIIPETKIVTHLQTDKARIDELETERQHMDEEDVMSICNYCRKMIRVIGTYLSREDEKMLYNSVYELELEAVRARSGLKNDFRALQQVLESELRRAVFEIEASGKIK